MKTKILLFLILIAGHSLKAQNNYISISGSNTICSSMDSPAVGGTYESAKSYYYQYRYLDIAGNAIPGQGWNSISTYYVDHGQLASGAITIEDRAENYKVEVRRYDGSAFSPYPPTFTVYCLAGTPASVLNINSTDICYNNNIIITGNSASVGYGGVEYTWNIFDTNNNRNLPSPPNGKDLNIVLAPGDYRITRNHSGECTIDGSANKLVRVFTASVSGAIGRDQSISFNQQPAVFTNERLPAGGGRLGYSYQWQKSSNGSSAWSPIDGATHTTYLAPKLTETTYYRRAETDKTCLTTIYSNVVKVHVDIPLQGGEITTPSHTCCYKDELDTFEATEAIGGILPYSYEWLISDDGSRWAIIPNGNGKNLKYSSLTNTKYFRRGVTDGDGTTRYTDPIKITVREEFLPGKISGDQTICKGAQPEMINQIEGPSGGSGTYSFIWENTTDQQIWRPISGEIERNFQPPALVQTHYYRRIVTDDICGTIMTDISTVFVAGPLVDTGIKYDGETEICLGTSLAEIKGLGVSGGGGNYSYEWENSDDEGKNWSPINDSNVADLLPKPINKNMLFRRKVSGLCESKTSDYVAIAVYEVPQPLTNEKGSYCQGDDASIGVENANNQYTYKWYDDEGTYIQEGVSIDYPNLQESLNLYVEAIEINNGCGSLQKTVQLKLEKVIADFEANLEKVDLGYPVEFTNNSQNAASYKWNFLDGSDLIFELNPWHYYNKGSLTESVFYDVELTATSLNGCVNTKRVPNMVEVLQFNESNGRVIEFLSGNIVKVASSDKRIGEETTNTDGGIFVNNPVKDILIITTGENISKVLVYSLSGQLVKRSDKKMVNLSSLKTGIYLVVIETESKNYKQVKIQKL